MVGKKIKEEKRVIQVGVAEARFRRGGHRWPFWLKMRRSQPCDDLGEDHSGTGNSEQRS